MHVCVRKPPVGLFVYEIVSVRKVTQCLHVVRSTAACFGSFGLMTTVHQTGKILGRSCIPEFSQTHFVVERSQPAVFV